MLKYKKNRGKKKLKAKRLIFFIIIISGFILLFFNEVGLLKWYQLREEKNLIQAEINHLLLQEKNLIQELDRLANDDEYIKEIARSKFHMVKPGEKIFHVVDRRKVALKK